MSFLNFAVPLLLTYQLRSNNLNGEKLLQSLIHDTVMEVKATMVIRQCRKRSVIGSRSLAPLMSDGKFIGNPLHKYHCCLIATKSSQLRTNVFLIPISAEPSSDLPLNNII